MRGAVTRVLAILTLAIPVLPGLALPVLAPGPAAAQSAAALAPPRSPQPPRRPVMADALSELTASPSGIQRPPAPPPRPTGLQLPASMIPVSPRARPVTEAATEAVAEAAAAPAPAPAAPAPEAGVAMAITGFVTDLPVFDAPADAVAAPDLAPDPAPDPAPAVAPEAVGRAVESALAAAAPAPRPEAIAAAVAAAQAAGLDPALALSNPRAVARSPAPPQRTAAAQRRFRTAAAARASQPAAPVVRAAAGGQAPAASTPSGPGLCGDPGLQGRRLARITSSTQGCGVAEPVSVTHVHGIRLSQPATLHCDAARATSRWVRDVMIPAVGRQGGGIAQIQVPAHYACRTRNHQRGARISEHGRGRAIDISGYRLSNGTQVSILRDYRSGPHSSALRRMRAGACGIFRTTLGPGVRFHDDHFHFDVAQHRGGGTFCR